MSEPKKIFIAAAPGMRVKDPYTLQVLAPQGEWKPETTYWLRQLASGDVVILYPPQVAQAPSSQNEQVNKALNTSAKADKTKKES